MAASERWKPQSRVPSQARSLHHSPEPNPHKVDDRPHSLTPNPIWKSPDRHSIPPASPFTPAPLMPEKYSVASGSSETPDIYSVASGQFETPDIYSVASGRYETPDIYSVASGRYETPEIRARSRRDQSCNTTPQPPAMTSQDAQTMTSPEPRMQLLERHQALLFPRRRGPMKTRPREEMKNTLKPREVEIKDTTHYTAMNWRFVEDEIVHNVTTGQRRDMRDNIPGLSQLITLHILNRDEQTLPPIPPISQNNYKYHQNMKW